MCRMLLAVMLAGALTAGASGSTVQFAVGGVPVGAGEVIEVEPSDDLLVGIYVTPDEPIENMWVDFLATGPWPGPPVWPEDIVLLPPWEGCWPTYDPDLGVYSIGGLASELWAGPGAVAEFLVHIPDVPVSTTLNLEYDYAEVGAGGVDMLPLVLHVTPEPVSLGLLALGGLVALRRRLT